MSDTTTITPEERALWASTAAARINAVTPERQCEITAQERLVKALKAIEQTEARAEKAEAEVARLRAELETAKQVAASAQAVAQEAWAGEIPSPLPGHKRANEEELLAQVEHLNCPLCGGSGHIGDCEGD